MKPIRRWKVSWVCVQDRAAHYPFYKQATIVEARSRADAIQSVKGRFPPPRYGEYRASPLKDGAA